MLVPAEDVAARDIRKSLVHIGHRAGQIVLLLRGALGDALIDQPARRVLH
jgi:hypothetical protein